MSNIIQIKSKYGVFKVMKNEHPVENISIRKQRDVAFAIKVEKIVWYYVQG